jgi:hypothetical protein
MKNPTIRTAEHVARAAQGDGAIVLILDGDQIAGASWGATVPRCRRLGRMLDAIVDAISDGQITGGASEPRKAPAAPPPAVQADPPAEQWEEFVGEAQDLIARLDDLPDRAEDFADGVRERLEGMIKWAEENEHVTGAMLGALGNMSAGVARWER